MFTRFASFLFLFVSITSFAAELEVDTSHSAIGFDIKHLMISTVHGIFSDFTGKIDADFKDLTKSKIEFTVKTHSINTYNQKRDEHLRGEDFFDVGKHPEAKFVSKAIKKVGKDKYALTGDLTIHGVTRFIKFDLEYLGKSKDPWGNSKHGFQAVTKLKRKDFGIHWNKALETGGVLIGEDVKLTVDLEASEKKAS